MNKNNNNTTNNIVIVKYKNIIMRGGEFVEVLDEGLVGGRRGIGMEESGWRRSGEELVEEGEGGKLVDLFCSLTTMMIRHDMCVCVDMIC